jgi:prefoldin subunit 5
VRYTDQKAKLDFTQPRFFVVDCKDSLQAISWNETRQIPASLDKLSPQPVEKAGFFIPPAPMTLESSYKAWKKEFMHWLIGSQKFYLLLSPSTKQYSNAGETERDFRLRLMKTATEKRDSDVTKLKQKYAPRLTALEQKIRRAQADFEQAQIHARERQVGAAIDIGATVLGAIVGRRGSTATLRQARTAAKDISKMAGGAKTIESTGETLQSLENQLHELDHQFREELRQVEQKYNPSAENLEPVGFAPKQTNVSVGAFVPVWAPYALLPDGGVRELWR